MFCYSRESHTSQGRYRCVPRNEKKGRKEGHPPLRSPINPMLPEGDYRRQKPVTSCVSREFIYLPLHRMCSSRSFLPDLMCSQWLKIVSRHHKRVDKETPLSSTLFSPPLSLYYNVNHFHISFICWQSVFEPFYMYPLSLYSYLLLQLCVRDNNKKCFFTLRLFH